MSRILRERSTIWTIRAEATARGLPTWLLLPALMLVAAGWWALLQDAVPYLGHDEAVYATKARSWLTDQPAAQWDPRRAPGMPALGAVALAVHASEGAVRLVGLGLLLVTVVVAFLVAREWIGRTPAFVAVLVVVTGAGFVRRAPEFLSDIGAAGMLVAVAYFLVRAQNRPGGRDLLAVPLCALAALYLRYGALAGLLALGLAAVAAWGPRAWLAQGWRLVGAAGIFVAGLLPHLVFAWQVTGSPFGLLVDAGESANSVYLGDGLVYYVTSFPYRLAGPHGALVMTAGLVATGMAAWRLVRSRSVDEGSGRSGARPGDRRTFFLGFAAVLLAVLLGLTAHGEARFVFLSLILLGVLGVDALARWGGRWAPAVLAGLVALSLAAIPLTYGRLTVGVLAPTTGERASLVAAATSLRTGSDCLLVTSYQPELGWYSGCRTAAFWKARAGTLPAGVPASYVLFAHGRTQPTEAEVRRLAAGRPVEVRDLPAAGALGRVRILTVR